MHYGPNLKFTNIRASPKQNTYILNSIIPTSGVLLASLSIAGVPYERWVKFVWKLIAGWIIIGAAAIVIAMIIGIK
ncbi:hypothetical protein DT075_37240 [Bacillus licheniformis]|nr:hypothetical protein DT075_37240 [Bacillus licheniformis]